MSTAPEPDDTAATNAPLDTLDCKACGRTMAIISTEGDMEPQGVLDEGCGLCKHFLFYFQEYDKAKELFKELEDRRDNFQPRVARLDWQHQMQMLLGNYIQKVTVWDNPDEEEDGAEIDFGDEIEKLRIEREAFPASDVESGDEEAGGVSMESSTEPPREREHTEGNKDQDQPEDLSKPPPSAPTSDSPPPPPAPPRPLKRTLSLQSLPGPRAPGKRPRLSHEQRTRRISFDSSVVFRDIESESRRVDAEFSRRSDGYSPGRWAAPEGSEWLDTSGHGTTIAKFTGVNKRGSKWVPNKEGVEKDEEWERARAEEGKDGEGEGGAGGEDTPVEGISQGEKPEREENEGIEESVGDGASPDDSKVSGPDAGI